MRIESENISLPINKLCRLGRVQRNQTNLFFNELNVLALNWHLSGLLVGVLIFSSPR